MSNYFADVSNNNGGFSAGAYASSGAVAIMLKATESNNFIDPFYMGSRGTWVRDSHRHGLPVFHYHFARPEAGNPIGQAEHFWNVVREHFRRPGDYLVTDLETGDPREAARWLPEYEHRLESLSDAHPWCYTYLSYFLQGGIRARSGRMHIAAWGSHRPGSVGWRLPFGQTLAAWQFTDGVNGPTPHTAPGVPGRCDGSFLNPSIARSIRKQTHRKG